MTRNDLSSTAAPPPSDAEDRGVLCAWVLTAGAMADLLMRQVAARDAQAHAATLAALKAGGHLRLTTGLSPAGLLTTCAHLVLANGHALELASIDLAGPGG
jgi:hypothetical protein